MAKKSCKFDGESELRRGPWTLEEDTLLIHYIACHGEGRWNLLARCSGLKRTGKSCRLRWLNYLKPDVKRGNLTPEEQLLILELHSKWGNRWSRIAQHLPGRTDNEIKNYWRTRVQKQARQLKCDANSIRFRDTVRCYLMPRLIQKMEGSSSSPTDSLISTPTLPIHNSAHGSLESLNISVPQIKNTAGTFNSHHENSTSENCSSSMSIDSMKNTQFPPISEFPTSPLQVFGNFVYNPLLRGYHVDNNYDPEPLSFASNPVHGFNNSVSDQLMAEGSWGDELSDNLWNMDEFWLQNSI